MSNIFFLYGDDEDEILREVNNKSSTNNFFNFDKKTIEKKDDLEKFYLECSELSLFEKESVLLIYLDNNGFKLLEDDKDRFCNFLNANNKYKAAILIYIVKNTNKNLKNQIMESTFIKYLNATIEEYTKLRYWQKTEMRQKIVQKAHKCDLTFDEDALDLFLECINIETINIDAELEKIKMYLLPENQVTTSAINDLFFGGASIEDLYELIIKANTVSVHNLINGLQKINPLYLIASLQNKLRHALKIKACSEEDLNIYNISKLTGIHSYRLEKELNKLKNTSTAYLKKLVTTLSDIEYKIKNGFMQEDNALDLLMISFT